jgi:hypothetical protein
MSRQRNIKKKFSQIVFNLHQEILRTSSIGKKMLSAGRTNAHLRECYEELGRLIETKIDSNDTSLEDAKVRLLVSSIKACKKDLKEIEEQVNRIKFSPCPEDISKKLPYSSED